LERVKKSRIVQETKREGRLEGGTRTQSKIESDGGESSSRE